jgi:hypothetical protein
VAFINDWADLLTVDEEQGKNKLRDWLIDLAPYYVEGSALRKRILDRLKTSY